MKKQTLHQNIRNIGIIAHVDAGKTTVSERILYYTGQIHQVVETHQGGATMDWDDREKNHGITINSAATTVEWREHQINLIDTPGHVDFGIEVKRSLRILDGAVVVFDAVSGVEPQTETNWRLADEFGVSRIAFINKMDRAGADFDNVIAQIQERLGITPLPLQRPVLSEEGELVGVIDLIRQEMICWLDDEGLEMEKQSIPQDCLKYSSAARATLIEWVVEREESLLAAYLDEGREPSETEILESIRDGVLRGEVVPVACGSALRNRGMQPLLDMIVDLLPSPDERALPDGVSAGGGLVAYAFKTMNKGSFGAQTWLRIYAGELSVGDRVWNASQEVTERIGRLVRINSNREEDISAATSGDIVAVLGMKHTLTGDTLCEASDKALLLERLSVPEPMTRVAVEAANRDERDKLGMGLNRLTAEDPTLRVSVDSETGQSVLAGMGELHLEMAKEKLESELGIKIEFGRPEVAYRESIRNPKLIQVRHRKQGGGPGQFADVEIRFEPLPRGAGFEFVSEITGGAIDQDYIPGVERGIRSAMQSGVLEGFPVTDVRALLLDGATHPEDSSALAFEIAGAQAFREAMVEASPVVLEPVMQVHVTTPAEYVGDVISDLNRRRGMIEGQSDRGVVKVITAAVPLAELFGYIGDLRSVSSGRASFTMEFDHYAEKAA